MKYNNTYNPANPSEVRLPCFLQRVQCFVFLHTFLVFRIFSMGVMRFPCSRRWTYRHGPTYRPPLTPGPWTHSADGSNSLLQTMLAQLSRQTCSVYFACCLECVVVYVLQGSAVVPKASHARGVIEAVLVFRCRDHSLDSRYDVYASWNIIVDFKFRNGNIQCRFSRSARANVAVFTSLKRPSASS